MPSFDDETHQKIGAILARLDDPADRLDLTDLMRLMEATMKVDDNPPT